MNRKNNPHKPDILSSLKEKEGLLFFLLFETLIGGNYFKPQYKAFLINYKKLTIYYKYCLILNYLFYIALDLKYNSAKNGTRSKVWHE
jgi:hypothetical protein